MLGLLLTAAAGPTAPVATDPAAPTFTFKQVADMNNLVGAYPSDGPGTNSSNGVSRFLGRTDTVAECQDLCASLSGCHSYTWCDEGSRGGYGKTCYMRTDNAWCDASSAPCHEADHMSGRKLPVVPTPSPPPAQQCATPKDCSYNGACSGGRCVCSRAWTGPACGQLALMPLEPESSGIYKDPAVRSWGASLWHDPPVLGSAGGSPAGLWHLFANEIKGGCSLYDWDPNSQIVHLTSPTLDAKFTRQAVVLPPFSSNPAVRFDRNTATFLLFYIGTNGSVPGLPTAPHCNTSWPKQPGVPEGDQIYLATAKSLSGPWETSAAPVLSGSRYNGASKSSWDYHRTNPAPVVLPNGTVLLYFRGTPGDAYGERMGLAIADNFSAPFVPLPDAVIDDFNEDPFVWIDAQGWSHVLLHGSYCECGHHYASADGLHWDKSAGNAYSNVVEWQNGSTTTLVRRERPQLHFGTNGEPTHLLTGAVDQGRPSGDSYTLLQRINTSATGW